jgi:hypothetical protein
MPSLKVKLTLKVVGGIITAALRNDENIVVHFQSVWRA